MRVWDRFLSESDHRMVAVRPPRQPTGIGERPAVLVIDMQRSVMGDDRPFHEQADRSPGACGDTAWAALRHMRVLLRRARAAGWPVIYTRQVYYPHAGVPLAVPSHPLSSLNPLSEIEPALAMQDGDLLVEKNQPSAFCQTGLVHSLLSKRVDSLIVVGNSTSGCVRQTIVDAMAFKFKVSVVEECVFDRVEASHAVALFDMAFKYCDVIGIDDVYARLDSSS